MIITNKRGERMPYKIPGPYRRGPFSNTAGQGGTGPGLAGSYVQNYTSQALKNMANNLDSLGKEVNRYASIARVNKMQNENVEFDNILRAKMENKFTHIEETGNPVTKNEYDTWAFQGHFANEAMQDYKKLKGREELSEYEEKRFERRAQLYVGKNYISNQNRLKALNETSAQSAIAEFKTISSRDVNFDNVDHKLKQLEFMLRTSATMSQKKISKVLSDARVHYITNAALNAQSTNLAAINMHESFEHKSQQLDDQLIKIKERIYTRGGLNASQKQSIISALENRHALEKQGLKRQQKNMEDAVEKYKDNEKDATTGILNQIAGDKNFKKKYLLGEYKKPETPKLQTSDNFGGKATGQVNPAQWQYENLIKQTDEDLNNPSFIYDRNGKVIYSAKSLSPELQMYAEEAIDHDPVLTNPELRKEMARNPEVLKKLIKSPNLIYFRNPDGNISFRFSDLRGYMMLLSPEHARMFAQATGINIGSSEQRRAENYIINRAEREYLTHGNIKAYYNTLISGGLPAQKALPLMRQKMKELEERSDKMDQQTKLFIENEKKNGLKQIADAMKESHPKEFDFFGKPIVPLELKTKISQMRRDLTSKLNALSHLPAKEAARKSRDIINNAMSEYVTFKRIGGVPYHPGSGTFAQQRALEVKNADNVVLKEMLFNPNTTPEMKAAIMREISFRKSQIELKGISDDTGK